MIHLSNPAAYHDKRFKNNPTKRKTMKTPLPEPAYTDSMLHEPTAFTEAQMKAAMVAAWNDAIEACVNAYSPDDTADDYTDKMMAMKETP